MAGSHQMEIVLDLCQHGTQSLLHPALEACQGPALCAVLHGVELSGRELCMLLEPPQQLGLRGRPITYGRGLQAAFALTDVVQVGGSGVEREQDLLLHSRCRCQALIQFYVPYGP